MTDPRLIELAQLNLKLRDRVTKLKEQHKKIRERFDKINQFKSFSDIPGLLPQGPAMEFLSIIFPSPFLFQDLPE
jgi:hypothetical protein